MEYAIRRATPADGAAIGELTAAAYHADGLLEDDAEYLLELRDGAGRIEQTTVLLAEVDGLAVGSIAIAGAGSDWAEIADDGQCELRMLSVLPPYRGHGIATALTLAAIDEARRSNYRDVVLSSTTAMLTAHRLYERLGFARWPAKDWSVEGTDLIAYRMSL